MNLFDTIPSAFFNYLASGSNNRIYADCLMLIYQAYDREISYRIPRERIRDVLAAYIMDNQVEVPAEAAAMPPADKAMPPAEKAVSSAEKAMSPAEKANLIIRNFSQSDVGWLEEENDDATYERSIVMTERGILLAEFLQNLGRPEKEEFSGYIFAIYNTLKTREQWKDNPYVDGLKSVYRNAKLLSGALKKLSTFIRKIIERMVQEETLESLTENLIEYCEGSFVREYARLTRQQNIHLYRDYIRKQLDRFRNNEVLHEALVTGCMAEEGLDRDEAAQQVSDMILATRQFLTEDYDAIMREIKHKINVYLQIAVGRARFLRNREADTRGYVEQTLKYLIEDEEAPGLRGELPEEMRAMFLFDRQEFIDQGSLRYPRKQQTIRKSTEQDYVEMSQEDIDTARQEQTRGAFNPYNRKLMKQYLELQLGKRQMVEAGELPLESGRDLLCALSAAAYAGENGFEIRPGEGYIETQHLILRNFTIRRSD